jgi:hypothetical protein
MNHRAHKDHREHTENIFYSFLCEFLVYSVNSVVQKK